MGARLHVFPEPSVGGATASKSVSACWLIYKEKSIWLPVHLILLERKVGPLQGSSDDPLFRWV